MTESALEKARRECEELSRESESSDALECARDAIAAIDRLEAAARLAGRLEQIEDALEEWAYNGQQAFHSWLCEERDRLRKEAGE